MQIHVTAYWQREKIFLFHSYLTTEICCSHWELSEQQEKITEYFTKEILYPLT